MAQEMPNKVCSRRKVNSTMMLARPNTLQSVAKAYDSTHRQWQTCDWTTEFGGLKLNLRGLRSAQALRLAKATCGSESNEWRMAAKWLRTIENGAATAESFALLAVDAASIGDHADAVKLIAQAVEAEAAWHEKPIWRALQIAIQRECSAV
jgi:hypothetical protein